MLSVMAMPQHSSYRYLVFAAGAFVQFAIGTIIYVIPPMAGLLKNELGLTYSELGLVLGIVSLAFVALAFPSGLLVDRIGGTRAVALGMTIVAIFGVTRGIFPTVSVLLASTFLMAVGVVVVAVGMPKVVGEWFSPKQIATVYSVWSGFWSVGSLVAFSATMSFVYPLMGSWTGILLFYGLLAAASSGLWWVFGKEPVPASPEPREDRFSLRADLLVVARHKTIWLLCGMFLCVVGAEIGIASWLPHILELKGLSPAVAGYSSSLIWLGALLSFPVGAASDRMGVRIPFLIVCSIMYGVAVIVAGATLGFPLWVAATLVGFTLNAAWILILIMPLEIKDVGPRRAGAAMGLIYTFGFIGGFIMPLLGGYLEELTGDFSLSVALFAVTAWATTILAVATKETGWKRVKNGA